MRRVIFVLVLGAFGAVAQAHADLGKLSPLPPSFAAESMTLNHGIAPKLLPVLQGNDSAGCAC